MAVIRYRIHVITAMLVFAALALVILHQAPETLQNMPQLSDYPIQAKADEVNDDEVDNTEPQADEVNDDADDDELVRVERDVPLIWVGGVPRSGTTLMR